MEMLVLLSLIDNFFGTVNSFIGEFLFWRPPVIELPFILLVMVAGGIFFTFRYRFVNVRLFKHAIDVIRGRYDDPKDPGEVSHFQALTSALSATVGLGNIAGVAVAIQLGGPGAVFWLWFVAFFGMSMKFSSCTFAQLYRYVDSDGHVLGGPMVYLKEAFADVYKMFWVGKFFGAFYAVMIIIASFGAGNLFQSNQSYELLAGQFEFAAHNPILVGLILAFFVAIVIIGGIKRIGRVTSKMVPAMCLFYIASCLIIVLSDYSRVPQLFIDIFVQAFNPEPIFAGGLVGVLIQGVKRASFSNEAGLGSAAIAHAAAKTHEPVREGVVAMLGPFIDTIVVCTMSALAILITDAHLQPELAGKGSQITAAAFATLGSTMPLLLTVVTLVFAYSTIISWSYYGERGVEYLWGKGWITAYRIMFVIVVVLGPIVSMGNIIDFSDSMFLLLAFPNIIGMMFLSKRIAPLVKDYVKRLRSGSMKYHH